MGKRVLFINRSYWPDAEATGQLLTDLCEGLSEEFEIAVLCGQPNANPHNEAFKRRGCESKNLVEIHRVGHFVFDKHRSLFHRAANLISFLLVASVNSVFMKQADVVVVETDPFLLPALGRFLKFWKRSKLVVYLQDIYPDVAIAVGKVKPGFITKTVRFLLFGAYKRADRIIVLSHDMKRRLVEHGVDQKKIIIIPNWIDTKAVYPIKGTANQFRKEHALGDKFVVMHSGNMGLTQGLEQLVDAADRLRERADICFLLVGGGAACGSLKKMIEQRSLANIQVLPYQPRNKLAESLSAADLHVISMHPDITGCLMPSKMYGILASGTPLLAIVPEGTDVAQTVDHESVGVAVTPGDLDGIERQIIWCADHREDLCEMGNLARALAETTYDRQVVINMFHGFLNNLLE
ncbi:MAG: glycosyltransferase family 4 protein [Planctomycetes bacterium]|nr:glycosyltransferase family 4 protein [Planctomycetota bacterium]